MDLATGAIGSIISKLSELLKAEYNLQTGVKKQVESLTRELQSAQDFLREIDTVPSDQLNRQVKSWADEVREASYDMEDILDTFLASIVGPESIQKNKLQRLKKKMRSLFISTTKARHNIANAIADVKEKLKEIDERRRRYKLDELVVSPATPSTRVDPRIARVHGINASLLIGIDEAKNKILRMLSHEDDMPAKNRKVVSLVGFGGIGKTTLAKATYDQIKQEYDCGAFVSIGRNPDLVKVFKDILYNLGLREIHSTQRGPDLLIPELAEFLRDKRYLIVIDDVWETQTRKSIVEALTDNNIGSRIIITTRKEEVAIGEVYKVQRLSDDNSKKLFYTRIFGGEDKCPDNQRQMVTKVADEILKKCGGIPLAIITMASLLVGKSMEEWLEVCNSIGFCGKDKEQTGDTEWILSLSYYDLPSHLKTCLLYLSIFPEDYVIKKDVLIWLWIGEGFINVKPGIGLFETGEGYFNDLINRSLIQPVEREANMVKGCRVHDMILDLIRSLSHEAKFATVSDNGEEISRGSKARRLALQKRVVEDTPQGNHTGTSRVRSLVAFMCHFDPRLQVQNYKHLRVLYLEGCKAKHFDVGYLLHLRCLIMILPDIHLMDVPKGIEALKFLQVLDLRGCSGGSFPRSVAVGMLPQLVCLRAWVSHLDGSIRGLTSLQELQLRQYTIDDLPINGQFVKDLGSLLELRRLEITAWDRIDENMQSDLCKSLGNLHKMQRLELLVRLKGLPSCIDRSCHPTLSYLCLTLRSLGDQGLEILGDLPELCYLWLEITCYERATVNGTAAHVYFRKLRSCWLEDSMIQFVVNEEDSSLSFTMWNGRDYAPAAFGSQKKQESCSVAGTVMPNLEALRFRVHVRELRACKNGSCDNLGLECLASLQKVSCELRVGSKSLRGAEEEEAALRHAIKVHPNQPTLYIFWRQRSEDDDLAEEGEMEEASNTRSDEGVSPSDQEDTESQDCS